MAGAEDAAVTRWLDPVSAARAAGVALDDVLAAVSAGDVRMTMSRPGHVGELLVAAADVERLAGLHRLAREVFPSPRDEDEPPDR